MLIHLIFISKKDSNVLPLNLTNLSIVWVPHKFSTQKQNIFSNSGQSEEDTRGCLNRVIRKALSTKKYLLLIVDKDNALVSDNNLC